jgi:23S rRNA (adenine2503-C2)-methyltransferase
MKLLARGGKEDLAYVHVAELAGGRSVEFVESVQPPRSRGEKWVNIVSTMSGCPVRCQFCDAGGGYRGNLSADEIMAQIDHLVRSRFSTSSNGRRPLVPVEKWKVQFARMGEPVLNPAVLEVLRALPARYDAPGLFPSISTVAPRTSKAERFLEELLELKQSLYPGRFQFQLSVHTTDDDRRSWLVPVKTWSLAEMARYGERFFEEGDRKVSLNFALTKGSPIDPVVLTEHFSPSTFLIKLTPVNPTFAARRRGITSAIDGHDPASASEVIKALEKVGYEVLLSIGELEENQIGSNCGQYISAAITEGGLHLDGYGYPLEDHV